MTIQITRERYPAAMPDIMMLAGDHWREVEFDAAEHDLAISHDMYVAADSMGSLLTLCARDDGKLVGYAVWSVGAVPTRAGTLIANNEALYVAPSYRGRMVGIRLVKESEKMIRSAGVKMVAFCAKSGTEASDLVTRLGYVPDKVTHVKWLGD